MRLRPVLVLLLAPLLLSACFGSGDKNTDEPESAVRQLLDGIENDDRDRIANAIDPAYSDTPASVGIGDVLRLARVAKVSFENLDLRAEYDPSLEHARVFVTMRLVSQDANGEVDTVDMQEKVLLTSKIDGRWYVTSPASPYWTGQLRPAPSDWDAVQKDASPNLPGEYVPPHPGADGELGTADDRGHFPNDEVVPTCSDEQVASGNLSNPLCYPTDPPTSGPHAASAAPFRIFNTPVAKEYLVHTMEHGGVVVWYNTDDEDALSTLTDVVQEALAEKRFVTMAPYPELEPDTIALTAWTRLDKFAVADLTAERLQEFIQVYDHRFNPEGF